MGCGAWEGVVRGEEVRCESVDGLFGGQRLTSTRVSDIEELLLGEWGLTSTMSMFRGCKSVLVSFRTNCSSSTVFTTTYTTKPRRSRSKAEDRVIGSFGLPAMTTTSFLAPLPALFALLFLPYLFFLLYTKKPPVPTNATIAAVNAWCLRTQSWAWARYPFGTAGITRRGGGVGGLTDCGIHVAD